MLGSTGQRRPPGLCPGKVPPEECVQLSGSKLICAENSAVYADTRLGECQPKNCMSNIRKDRSLWVLSAVPGAASLPHPV